MSKTASLFCFRMSGWVFVIFFLIPGIVAAEAPPDTVPMVDERLRQKTQLWSALADSSFSDKTVDNVRIKDLKEDIRLFMADYDEQTPFWGVYFKTGVFREIDAGRNDFDYRLEWDLFKNGRFEMKRDFDKKRNQNELQALQLLSDAVQHELNESLDRIEFLSQAVYYRQAVDLSQRLSAILERRAVQLEKGYITQDDFDHIRFKYRQSLLEQSLYAAAANARMDPSVHALLNRGEFLVLKAIEDLKKTALEQAHSLKIQKNMARRADFSRAWTDDVAVNLYIEQKDRSGMGMENNVGVEVAIPLHWYSRRAGLIEREKKLYERQARMLAGRICVNVEKLCAFFAYQQNRIAILLLELEKTAQRAGYENERAKRILEDLDYTPERALDLLVFEENDLRYEVMQTRLKLYEILVKLMAVTHAGHPRELIAGTQKDCPVH